MNVTNLLVLMIGVLIGTSIAGVIAHTINYFADVSEVHEQAILACYILAVTIGLGLEDRHPIVVLVSSYIGIVIIGGRVFNLLKGKLPNKVRVGQ